jgi:GNAT superfamily N-acetyltransferase
MEQITIRQATLNDLDTLLGFEQDIVEAERPFDNALKDGEIHYYDIAAMITAPDVEVLVAVHQDQLIGSGYARIRDAKPYLKHKQYVHLGFMYVTPAYRGKGINQLIVAGLKEWAQQQHITEMRLEVYSDNEVAIKAYEKAGFRKNLVEMRLGI